ncbi:MAG TPA: hypothetical protein VH083_18100 [Myxococcales bacterium]|jgi:hypothetical protein|nr:hypothetical protein [Myxococcales bacterium]
MPLYSESATVRPPRSVLGFADAATVDAGTLAAWSKPGAALGFTEVKGVRYPIKQYAFKVSQTLSRGARTDAQGLLDLKGHGFKGVANVAAEIDEGAAVKAAGLMTLRLEIAPEGVPAQEQMRKFLDFASNKSFQQVYVHGAGGTGRTGVAVACYRMAVQGWPADDALTEATKFGLTLDAQIDFLEEFYDDLLAGKIKGYGQ